MVKCVAPLSLSITVAGVVQNIERIHIVELRRLLDIKDLLVQRVEVLSVVDHHFAV